MALSFGLAALLGIGMPIGAIAVFAALHDARRRLKAWMFAAGASLLLAAPLLYAIVAAKVARNRIPPDEVFEIVDVSVIICLVWSIVTLPIWALGVLVVAFVPRWP